MITNQVYELILNQEQFSQLHATPEKEPFHGQSLKFSLGVETLRLGLVHEYEPYFSLTIAPCRPPTTPVKGCLPKPDINNKK